MKEKLDPSLLAGVLCIILSIVVTYAVFEITNLNDIANLRKSETWVEDKFILKANYKIDLDFKAPYAGYVLVNLLGSSSATVHVG